MAGIGMHTEIMIDQMFGMPGIIQTKAGTMTLQLCMVTDRFAAAGVMQIGMLTETAPETPSMVMQTGAGQEIKRLRMTGGIQDQMLE